MSLVHQVENNKETQEFLKSNGEKFQGDCLTVMRLLFSGIRLTAQDVVVKYRLHDRRLRECYTARPDLIKKEWKLNSEGKREYVEYFIPKFQPPKKSDLQSWMDNFQNEKPNISFVQSKLF